VAEAYKRWQRKAGPFPAVPQRLTLKQTEEAVEQRVGNCLDGNCHWKSGDMGALLDQQVE